MAVYADEEEQKSPLFEKLDTLAGQIGKVSWLRRRAAQDRGFFRKRHFKSR